MLHALELAHGGRFRVEPNPPVGAVVLSRDGELVGRGHHAAYAGPHAEPAALADAGDRAHGGTLVVTLEPCAHTRKKTPPCTAAITESGVARVVYGAPDPNPATSGQAAPLLRKAGVEVVAGVLEEECAGLLSRYVRHLASDVPWTIAKWAMSADGRTADANGSARWISGLDSRRLVHGLRARVEAIVVGRGTATRDDPALTARHVPLPPGRRPALRVVLDSRLQVGTTLGLVQSAREIPTLVMCIEGAHDARRKILEEHGVRVVPVADDGSDRVDLRAAFATLHGMGVRRALLESGGTLTAAALRTGVVHQVAAFVAPVIVGGERAPSPFAAAGWDMEHAPHLEEPHVVRIGGDVLLEGYWPGEVSEPLPRARKTHRVE